ncbi:MAG: FtsX-like permease family protein [Candidatus Chromulinivorax sp.]
MIFRSYRSISLRYLQAARQNPTIRTMISICFTGIFIATFALALIISITKGFEQATYAKMQSIYPEIIIDADGQDLAFEQISMILTDPAYHIAHFAPEKSKQILCKSIDSQATPYLILLKGVQPDLEKKVTCIEQMILPYQQKHYLEKLLVGNQIIVGKELAKQLKISTGSQLTLIYTSQEDLDTKSPEFEQTTAIVAGIFDTGIDDFDTHIAFCSLDFFSSIFEDIGITQIYATKNSQFSEPSVIKNLENRLQINVYSWKKLYSSLVAALDLEKYAMFFILLLIVLVASSNIISLLFMQLTQKQKDIAILLLFGLTLRKTQSIFMTLSMFISIIAAITGLITAYLVGIFLQNYNWIQLPDNVYYCTHLQIVLELDLFFLIFFVVLAITFFASLIPLHKITMKNIITVLQNEI